jgi:glycosyltransferase involved in cell wall biosynthesis
MESVIKLWEEIFAYPDFVSGWRKPAVNFANKLINSECIDAIISSSGPPTCNLIAKDLKEKHDIPWIADFRDLWTQNHYYQYSRFRHFFETKLELRSLSSADALTTVSQPLVVKLKQLHPAKKIFSIPNGFDPLQKNPGLPLPRQFTITYTGSLYRGKRDPEPLFQVLGEIVSNGLVDPNDLSVEFYGPREDWLKDEAKRYGLNGIVKINGAISRDASIEKQRRSHLLLLLTWDKPEEKGVYTGKVFDYLAAGRPILSMGISGGVVEDLLKCTGAGFHVSSQEDLKRIILNTYQEYKSTSTINYHGSVSEIDRFSHVEMARKFSAVLDELVKP